MAPCFPFNLCGGGGDEEPPMWARGYVSEWDRGRHEPHHRTARPGRPALREGSRTRKYNPGVNPSIPSARGMQEGHASPWSSGGFSPMPTPSAFWAGPPGATPKTRIGAHLEPPSDKGPVMPMGNDVVFPQHLPPGAFVSGVIDPNDPGAIWVDHPAPGPHTGAAVHTGHDFQFTTGQPVGQKVPPVFTPGNVPMPFGVSNTTPAQTFGVSPWAAAAPMAAPAAAVTPAIIPSAFATPAIPALATPAWTTIPAAVPTIPVATPAMAVATPAWVATPASLPSPPDWMTSTAPEVALIPMLGLNPIEPSYPHLKWDLAQMPSAATMKRITGQVLVKQITSKDFKQTALYPPKLDLHITLANIPAAAEMHAQWGPIIARCNKKGEVTVGDVLDAVYAFFQEQLYMEDFRAFSSWLGDSQSDPNYKALCKGFARRVKSSTGLSEVERKIGFRRIDLLGDNRRWCGLYRAPPSGPGDQTASFYLFLQPARS